MVIYGNLELIFGTDFYSLATVAICGYVKLIAAIWGTQHITSKKVIREGRGRRSGSHYATFERNYL